MNIVQIFNNNVVLTTDQENNEIVVMGKGIGFQKKKGDAIDSELIDKKFILSENIAKSIFPDIYHQLSEEEIDVVIEIINMAEEKLDFVYCVSGSHPLYARAYKASPSFNKPIKL